jgi:hypothetical protein
MGLSPKHYEKFRTLAKAATRADAAQLSDITDAETEIFTRAVAAKRLLDSESDDGDQFPGYISYLDGIAETWLQAYALVSGTTRDEAEQLIKGE